MTTSIAGAPGTRALITGVAGQDGVYLARRLLAAGHRVVGTVRPGTAHSAIVATYLDGVTIREVDQRDGAAMEAVLEAVRPDVVYNLAGFTSVGASWAHAEQVAEINGMAVLRLLEALLRYRDRHGEAPRFFQPSSSEMFGTSDQMPQTEGTPHHPRSPYAASKSFAHHLTINYRESYGLFTCTGILYNHESPLRGPAFVTRKIARGVAEIAVGRRRELTLGNLDVRRDWGYVDDYARAMQLMCDLAEPHDFIVATGESRGLREVVDLAFAAADLGPAEHYVRQDPALMRPADVLDLYGDPTKAREHLGWAPTITLESLVEHLVRTDIRRLETGVEEHPDYLLPPG